MFQTKNNENMKNIIRGTFAAALLLASCANGNFQMSAELEANFEPQPILRDEIVNICSSTGNYLESDQGFMISGWNATSDLNAEKDLKKEPVSIVANDLNEKLEMIKKESTGHFNLMLVRVSDERAMWFKY